MGVQLIRFVYNEMNQEYELKVMYEKYELKVMYEE
jgi:hypothetical protein